MKLALAYILYYVGDVISRFLYYNMFSFMYPLYNWLMLKSVALDTHEKIWKTP